MRPGRSTNVLPTLVALLLLSGCTETAPEHPEELTYEFLRENPDYLLENPHRQLEYFLMPKYGEEKQLKGVYWSHWETATISLCSQRKGCSAPKNVDGSDQNCWPEFTGEAGAALPSDLEEGEYWIEGTGRIAVLPGGFGHLNQYTCQIEISEITSFIAHPCLTMTDELMKRPYVVQSGMCDVPDTQYIAQ